MTTTLMLYIEATNMVGPAMLINPHDERFGLHKEIDLMLSGAQRS